MGLNAMPLWWLCLMQLSIVWCLNTEGKGDMAVSNAFGSNAFVICLLSNHELCHIPLHGLKAKVTWLCPMHLVRMYLTFVFVLGSHF